MAYPLACLACIALMALVGALALFPTHANTWGGRRALTRARMRWAAACSIALPCVFAILAALALIVISQY